MKTTQAVVAVACALLAACVRATEPYFILQSGDTQCFIADVPADTQLAATFAVLDNDQGPDTKVQTTTLKCWIESPDGFTVAETSGDGARSGVLTTRSQMAGEYRACVKSTKSRWAAIGETYRVALSLRDGVESIDYGNVAKTEELDKLQVALRRANDQIVHIRNEQSYQRNREQRFRQTSENTSSMVMRLAALQIVVFAGCTVFQLYSLRSFFRKNKLY